MKVLDENGVAILWDSTKTLVNSKFPIAYSDIEENSIASTDDIDNLIGFQN